MQTSLEELKTNATGICRTQGVGSALGAKLAPVPQGAPVTADWHVVRNSVVDAVRENLCDPGGPWMVAIVGRSGSGKTTAAAAIVGDNMGKVLPRDDETHHEACEHLEEIRRHFYDGVLWLRVGRGAGTKTNLPSLMLQLARMVGENLTDNCGAGEASMNQEGGTATAEYIRKKVASGNDGQGYRCLLVADDVWESEVVAQLQETGMRVLLTTRNVELVRGEKVSDKKFVGVDKLTPAEAEAALRGAAQLRSNVPLPPSAYHVIERCDWRAMYVGHVAKFEYLKGRKDEKAWKQALDAIDQNVETLVAERNSCRDGDLVTDRHHAILRAGFDCLASEVMHSKLYLALAVMPDTHSFAAYEAALLLFGHEYDYSDLERAEELVWTLERWAIVRVDGTGLYRMHDDLREFAKKTLRERGNMHRTAVSRWRDHLSTLDALRSVDLLVLLGLWQALENIGGEGWRASRAYDKAVTEMDPSDPTYFASVKVLASLYQVEGDFSGAEDLMLKVLERNETLPNANPLVIANALCWRVVVTRSRGQRREAHQLRTRIKKLVDSATTHWRGCERSGELEESLSLHTLGSLCLTAGRIEEAEQWFRQALEAHEAIKLGKYHAQVGATLQGLAHCVQHHPERQAEAEALFHRAIDIVKMRRGPDSLEEASTLFFLAVCELDANRPQGAESLFRRALDIYKRRNAHPARLEANALHSLAVCIREMGRWEEAEELLRTSLAIQQRVNAESELDSHIACTLFELSLCARNGGRPESADTLFRRAVRIEEEIGLRSERVIRARRPDNVESGASSFAL